MKTIFKLSALTSVLVGAVALVSLIPNDAQAGHNSYHFGNAYRNGYNGYSVYGRGPYGYGSTIYANPYAGNNYNNYNNYNNVYGYPSYGVGPYGYGNYNYGSSYGLYGNSVYSTYGFGNDYFNY